MARKGLSVQSRRAMVAAPIDKAMSVYNKLRARFEIDKVKSVKLTCFQYSGLKGSPSGEKYDDTKIVRGKYSLAAVLRSTKHGNSLAFFFAASSLFQRPKMVFSGPKSTPSGRLLED